MKKIIFLLASVLILTNLSALCNNRQIDINTASLEELDKLSGIGPVKAQAIIDARPFSSVDDLIKVIGIGNATLNRIKTQGLACVKDETDKKKEDNNEGERINVNATENNITDISNNESAINDNKPSISKIETIKLNYPVNDTKDIKTEENSGLADTNKESKIATYGFFVFSVLIGILLIIKRKNTGKNDI